MVQSQAWLGRPGRRFQSLGSPQLDICRALNVSCMLPILAACLKKLRRLVWMSDSSCGGESAGVIHQHL